MKSGILKISSVIAAMFIFIAAMPSTVFAAEQLTVNSDSLVNKDEEFEYILNLADCEVPIIGLQMYITYDSTKLSYVDDSINFDKIDSVVYNDKLENTIAITWTDISNEADFAKKASLLKCKFKAIGTGEAEVTYFISHMYGDDMGYIKNYTFTADIVPEKSEAVYDKPAIVTTDEAFLSSHSSSFVNYDDSMGENSPNADTHKKIVAKVINVTRYEEAGKSDSGSGTTVLIAVGAAIIILAVVAIIFVKRRDDAKKTDDNNKN